MMPLHWEDFPGHTRPASGSTGYRYRREPDALDRAAERARCRLVKWVRALLGRPEPTPGVVICDTEHR